MKTMPAFIPTALACLCLCAASLVQAEPSRTQAFVDCMDNVNLGAFKNSQWEACALEEITRQDAVLNTQYRAVRNALSTEQKEAMLKGQRAWLKYREDWCRFEEVGETAPGGNANYLFCILDLTDQQIARIKDQDPR